MEGRKPANFLFFYFWKITNMSFCVQGPLNAGVMDGTGAMWRSVSVTFRDSGEETLKSSRKNQVGYTQRCPSVGTVAAGGSRLPDAEGQTAPLVSSHSAKHPPAMAENFKTMPPTQSLSTAPGGRAPCKLGDPGRHRGACSPGNEEPGSTGVEGIAQVRGVNRDPGWRVHKRVSSPARSCAMPGTYQGLPSP